MDEELVCVAENIKSIKESIAKACISCGRAEDSVELVAVSKFQPPEKIEQAYAAGQRLFGENRAQEMILKYENFKERFSDIRFHFIGTFQENKAKMLVGKASVIESAASAAHLKKISERAKIYGVTQNVFLQVNIGSEAQKSGISCSEVDELLDMAGSFPSIRITGIMCIPPAGEDPEPYFVKAKTLFDNAAAKYNGAPGCVRLEKLSMGMSRDFEKAVLCGSDIVRVGTAIFGLRNV